MKMSRIKEGLGEIQGFFFAHWNRKNSVQRGHFTHQSTLIHMVHGPDYFGSTNPQRHPF